LAKEVCDQGRVTVNNRPAKAGTTLSVGDEIAIRYGTKIVVVRVEKLQESAKKEVASSMFTLLREDPVQQSADEKESLF
jgi:ribosomal 50S subunit-recycling heat shock protein